MAEVILLAVSKIEVFLLDQAVEAAIEKLSGKVADLWELPAKIRLIYKDLKLMDCVIQDIGTTRLTNNDVKGWIEIVRKLAYHVEDVIDKCLYQARKINQEFFLFYAFRRSCHIKVFSKIVDDVEEIEQEIKHIKEMREYTSDTDGDRRKSGGCFPELISDGDLVGIYENRSKMTEWLFTDEKESTVITVSGMGGLGKTTLVKNVYDREKANFPGAHAWIVVSQEYDVVDLLEKLLTMIRHRLQLPPAFSMGAKPDVFELTDATQKILQDRKCLIVLDDVWDREAYTQMQSAFQGLQGSRVIITTRKEDVAALAPRRRRLQLQALSSVESFELFCSRAFHDNNPDRNCPLELETVAAAVVERCLGLPLAIVSAGNLLSTKQPTQYAWNIMYNNLETVLRENNHFKAILSLSYHDLPGDLRNCFLYCTLFPQGHPMPRESLVRLWVAEGLAKKKEMSTPEEVAEENLMELICRNLLQVVERDEHEFLRVSTCIMHDIVRDLALDIAKQERFGSTNDQDVMLIMDSEVRRFSTCGWSDSSKTAPAGVEFPQLRTFVSIALRSSSTMLSSVFSGSSYLTVLELQDSAINHVPASIGNLFNLRYIGLRRTQVQSLPDTIDKLLNLETLDLKHTRIGKLPLVIVKLKKLRHLLADRYANEKQMEFRYCVGVEAPKVISNFEELQTLETVHASKELSIQLKKMSKLRTVCIDDITASYCEELFHALSNMPLLSSLLLSASDEKETLSFRALKPISNRIHRLIVRGGWDSETFKCPIFQGHGRNLKYLALSWCNFGTEKDPLGLLAYHMPILTYLSLNRVSSEGILVLSAGCLRQLKTLVLKRMRNVKQLVIEEGALPRIDGIYIMTLLGLNAVPRGLESLGSLTKLWILDVHTEFKTDWIRSQMHNKMRHVTELRV